MSNGSGDQHTGSKVSDYEEEPEKDPQLRETPYAMGKAHADADTNKLIATEPI